MTYRVEFWHTIYKKWCFFAETNEFQRGNELYEEALAWHYAKIVRLMQVEERQLKCSIKGSPE